jgi:hypothetical protein
MTEVESTRLWVAAIVVSWVAMVSGLALDRLGREPYQSQPVADATPPETETITLDLGSLGATLVLFAILEDAGREQTKVLATLGFLVRELVGAPKSQTSPLGSGAECRR